MYHLVVLVVLLLAGCRDVVAPAPDCSILADRVSYRPIVGDRPMSVTNESELYVALLAYRTPVFEGVVVITRPLDLALFDRAAVVLAGPGATWNGVHVERGFCCGPLITWTGRKRDAELRIRGLSFVARKDLYPGAGPSIELPYAQLSLFEDVRFEDHPGAAFIVDSADATEFRDVFLLRNGASAEVRAPGDVRWRGGAIESEWGRPMTGLRINGRPPGPNMRESSVVVEDVHMEGGLLEITDVATLSYRGGTYLASAIRLTRIDVLHWAGDGLWRAGSNASRDGRPLQLGNCAT